LSRWLKGAHPPRASHELLYRRQFHGWTAADHPLRVKPARGIIESVVTVLDHDRHGQPIGNDEHSHDVFEHGSWHNNLRYAPVRTNSVYPDPGGSTGGLVSGCKPAAAPPHPLQLSGCSWSCDTSAGATPHATNPPSKAAHNRNEAECNLVRLLMVYPSNCYAWPDYTVQSLRERQQFLLVRSRTQVGGLDYRAPIMQVQSSTPD
jgi:hypothetical protein